MRTPKGCRQLSGMPACDTTFAHRPEVRNWTLVQWPEGGARRTVAKTAYIACHAEPIGIRRVHERAPFLANDGDAMGIRFAPSGFVGQFRVDCRTLSARRRNGGGTFGERLVALDRIAGSTVMLVAICVAVWIIGQASPMTVLEPASATAATAAPELGLPTPETVPLTSAEVLQIQARLHAFGFNPGRADGIAGGRTLDALNRYRAARGLERVSYMDRATVTDLLN